MWCNHAIHELVSVYEFTHEYAPGRSPCYGKLDLTPWTKVGHHLDQHKEEVRTPSILYRTLLSPLLLC